MSCSYPGHRLDGHHPRRRLQGRRSCAHHHPGPVATAAVTGVAVAHARVSVATGSTGASAVCQDQVRGW